MVYTLKTKAYKVYRFGVSYTYWYTYAVDGITFTVNKKVRLFGLGMYGSHEGKVQVGNLKITEGFVNSGNVLYEQPIEVQPAPDQNNAIVFHQLKKPVTIRADTDYIIQILSTQYCYLYYGGQGKATIEGEKGVIFTFKATPSAGHGSSIEYGNFAEFHYYS